MELDDFIAKVKDEEQFNISVDFDGVIHDIKGVGNGTVSGAMVHGAKEALEKLSKNYRLILFTAKAKADRPLVNGKTGTELVWAWLQEHGLSEYFHSITSEKPRAFCYIDDKAIRFESWDQTLQTLDAMSQLSKNETEVSG